MTNPKWDNASVEAKLEQPREDIQHISDHHNGLVNRVRDLQEKVEALLNNRPKT